MILEKRKFSNTKNYLDYNNKSGIYALIHNSQIIYIGQSSNIRIRLLNHHNPKSKLKELDKKELKYDYELLKKQFYSFILDNMDDIEFIVLEKPLEELNQAEQYYIDKYKPKFNYAGVVVDYKPMERKVLTNNVNCDICKS